jgi:hypothetical protein
MRACAITCHASRWARMRDTQPARACRHREGIQTRLSGSWMKILKACRSPRRSARQANEKDWSTSLPSDFEKLASLFARQLKTAVQELRNKAEGASRRSSSANLNPFKLVKAGD